MSARLAVIAKPGVAVACSECGHSYPQDPVFNVACPACGAAVGHYCKRPSGHSGPFVGFHAERDVAALLAGHYDHPEMREACGPHSTSKRAEEIAKKYGFERK